MRNSPNIYLICDSQSLGLNDLRYLLSIPSFKGIYYSVGTFTSEIVAPFVITLRLPNRGRLMVNDQRIVSIKVSS